MARWLTGMAVSAALAVVVGCNDTPQTIATVKPVDAGAADKSAVHIAPEKAPDKSDPKAAEVVAAAVAAHTGGKPGLLQKFKSVRYTRAGKLSADGLAPADQRWEVFAVWPDRMRVRAEMSGPQVVTLAWTGATGWRHAAGMTKKIPMSEQEVADFRVEVTGEWLLFLFPLTEPGTVVAPVADARVNDRPAAGVRLWHPVLSDAVLYFDKETKLLARYTYEGRESGQKVTKEVTVLGHKEYAGVKLPERTVYKSNGAQFAEWTTAAIEPREKIDPNVFVEP